MLTLLAPPTRQSSARTADNGLCVDGHPPASNWKAFQLRRWRGHPPQPSRPGLPEANRGLTAKAIRQSRYPRGLPLELGIEPGPPGGLPPSYGLNPPP